MRNPLLDKIESELMPSRPYEGMSLFEKIGLASTIIFFIFILIAILVSLAIDTFVEFNFFRILFDLALLFMSFTAIYYALQAFKRKIVTDHLINLAFEDGLYQRLEPILQNIARTHVDMTELYQEIEKVDKKVLTLLKSQAAREIQVEPMKEPLAIGVSLKFTIKTMFMMIVSMATFILLGIPGMPLPHYILLALFILWWIFLTNEFELWRDTTAWALVFLPILAVPTTFILLVNLMPSGYNFVLMLSYISLGTYVFLYYIWAFYTTTGTFPWTKKTETPVEESEFFKLQKRNFLREILNTLSWKIYTKILEKEEEEEAEKERGVLAKLTKHQ